MVNDVAGFRAPGAVELLTKFRTQLAAVEPYEVPRLEAFSQEFIAAEGKKIGELVHPLRVALTGQGVGLGLVRYAGNSGA